jgi:hypothetical protein
MKWAIALRVGHGCMFWNGESFTNSEAEAAKFAKQDWAEKAMYAVFFTEPPTDEEDAAFDARLYIQAVA